jgi:hypothetical protein
MLCVILFVNCSELCLNFRATYRKQAISEGGNDIRARHARNYYWFGRFLYEAVFYFGENGVKDRYDHNGDIVYYFHGIPYLPLFNSFNMSIGAPIIASRSLQIAQMFVKNNAADVTAASAAATDGDGGSDGDDNGDIGGDGTDTNGDESDSEEDEDDGKDVAKHRASAKRARARVRQVKREMAIQLQLLTLQKEQEMTKLLLQTQKEVYEARLQGANLQSAARQEEIERQSAMMAGKERSASPHAATVNVNLPTNGQPLAPSPPAYESKVPSQIVSSPSSARVGTLVTRVGIQPMSQDDAVGQIVLDGLGIRMVTIAQADSDKSLTAFVLPGEGCDMNIYDKVYDATDFVQRNFTKSSIHTTPAVIEDNLAAFNGGSGKVLTRRSAVFFLRSKEYGEINFKPKGSGTLGLLESPS